MSNDRGYDEALILIMTVLRQSGSANLIIDVQRMPPRFIYQFGHYLIFAIDTVSKAEYEQTLIDDIIGYRDDRVNYQGKTKEF